MAEQPSNSVKAAVSVKPTLLRKEYTPPKGLLSKIPASWVPYGELIRLHRPEFIYFIYAPFIVGLAYALCINKERVPAFTLAHRAGVLFVWTFFLRSSGCAWNDNIDQDFDRQTERCRNRPIARGAITTTKGHVFTIVLISLGFLSIRSLPFECTLVGIVTYVLTIIYPFGKRFTNFPQVILGSVLAMAIPLSSYSLGLPALSPPHIVPTACLSAAIVFLIVFYDVLYACQDIEDDLKSGVKGMAVYFRNYIEPLLITVTGLITGCLAMMGKLIDMGQLFFMFSVIGVSMSLLFLVAIVHWKILPSWSGYSAWFYALAIVNLAGGFTLEYFTRVVEGL